MKVFLKLIRPCLMLDLRSLTVVLRSASRLFRKETINNYSWFGSTAGHSCHREWKDFRVFFALELRETYLVLQLKPEIWEKWEPFFPASRTTCHTPHVSHYLQSKASSLAQAESLVRSRSGYSLLDCDVLSIYPLSPLLVVFT